MDSNIGLVLFLAGAISVWGGAPPLLVAINMVVFLVPSYIALRIIWRVWPPLINEKVSRQILAGLSYIIPVIIVELIIDAIITVLFFGDGDVSGTSLFAEGIKGKALKIVKSQPWEKLESYAFLYAFLVPAAVEEGCKWRMAEIALRRNLYSYRGTVCITMLGALGFASGEHYLYSYSIISSSPNLTVGIITSLWRGALCFPLHIGTSTLIGVGLAEAKVLWKQNTFWTYFALAVLAHGTFDFLPFLEEILAPRKVLPECYPWLAVIAQLAISIILVRGGVFLVQTSTDSPRRSTRYGFTTFNING